MIEEISKPDTLHSLIISSLIISFMNSISESIQPIIDPQLLEQARQLIDTHQHFVITAHMSPDGDAVGSALGMMQYLKAKGKDAKVVFNDAPGENLFFIPGYRSDVIVYDNQNDGTPSQREEALKAIEECDAMIAVDFNVPSRIGGMKDVWMAHQAPKLLIDHHLDPATDQFDICISHPEQSAACELVCRFIIEMGDDHLLNHDIATSLFCGLMTDTGWFVFNSNRPDFHLVMARLMMENVDRENIIKDSHIVPERKLRLQGYMLQQKMHLEREHKAAFMSLSQAEIKRFNHQKGDSEGFVNLPLDIQGIQVSAFFRQEKNLIKVSLRSKGEYPVNLIAEKFFNGGGHRNAAGGEFYGSLAQAEALFVKVLPMFDKFLS